ncbi:MULTISPECIES: aminopeptidase P family protein [unclassified Paludibacterium]|uniref:aminopeptidase P family protein n=1 Tax=unclassified Paludibacterium TaxID=2618429 RepID=UPI001C04F4C1|nr:aminopeptidase P family protein [Paludibacterium sp. B53371]BEV72806.1 aminopeptidase P family protein [Paludibacterium sp. THUN1379]
MFAAEVYQQRRSRLLADAKPGLMLFIGNVDAPMNYLHNPYPFVQDSTFRYLFGLNDAGLAGVIDSRDGSCTLFGNDVDVDDIVWTGELPTLAQRAATVGISASRPYAELEQVLRDALLNGVTVHYLTPYRGETILELARLLGRTADAVKRGASAELALSIVALREVKGPEEIAEIERALTVTREMHITAMKAARPGVVEYQVVGAMEGIMRSRDWQLAYPVIFSRRGEVLHNHRHDQVLEAGDLVVNDTGASADSGYASDITRTIPVGGKFSERQRALYETVLAMQLDAIAAMRPGVKYFDVHKLAARTMVERMKQMGFFNGPAEKVVDSGAYAIAFPHGLGHQIGMDVHDMENLGETLVGYDAGQQRSELFGLGYLRMGKALRAGMVITVEPGIYFIPALIDAWQREGKFADLINYDKFNEFRDFGGIRIEDNVLVTETGSRVLGEPIPKTVAEVEAVMQG